MSKIIILILSTAIFGTTLSGCTGHDQTLNNTTSSCDEKLRAINSTNVQILTKTQLLAGNIHTLKTYSEGESGSTSSSIVFSRCGLLEEWKMTQDIVLDTGLKIHAVTNTVYQDKAWHKVSSMTGRYEEGGSAIIISVTQSFNTDADGRIVDAQEQKYTNGQQHELNTARFIYDAKNRLTQVIEGSIDGQPERTINYHYDINNRLIGTDYDKTTTQLIWDDSGRWLSIDSRSTTLREDIRFFNECTTWDLKGNCLEGKTQETRRNIKTGEERHKYSKIDYKIQYYDES